MKKRILFIVFLLIFPADAPAAWRWVNPSPTGEDLIDWSVAAPGSLIILGSNGFLMKNGDNGYEWSGFYAEGEPYLSDIFFSNADVAYGLADEGRIVKTVDGGKTWTEVLKANQALNDIYFFDESAGHAIGEAGTVFSTRDGGETWEWQDILPGTSLKKILFLNDSKGFILCSPGGFLVTADGGSNWLSYPYGLEFVDLHFVSESVGYGIVYEYDTSYRRYLRVYKTENGGDNWSRKGNIKASYSDNPSLIFQSDGRGLLLSYRTIYRAANDGQDLQIAQELSEDVLGLGESETGGVFAFGRNGLLLQSTDGGLTWIDARNQVVPLSGWYLRGGCSVSEETSFLVDQENIYRTIDNGLTWQKKLTASYAYFTDLVFPSSRVGYAVGTRLWKTADGGELWTPLEIGFAPGEAQFVDNERGFVSEEGTSYCFGGGYGGYDDDCPSGLYFTDDGGCNWSDVGLDPLYDTTFGISSFHFPVPSLGFVARYKNSHARTEIWRITNATSSPSSELAFVFDEDIAVLHFADEQTGIAAGKGKIYGTLNGGYGWEEVADLGSEYGVTEILKIFYDGKLKHWYLLADDGRVFQSEYTEGSLWLPFWGPGYIYDLFLHPSSLWALRYAESYDQVLRYVHSAASSEDAIPPETPVNLEPLDGEAIGQTMVLLRATVFADQNQEDTHAASRWQVATDPDFTQDSCILDNEVSTGNLTSHVVPAEILAYGLLYSFRVRYQDNTGLWSAWSMPTCFSINHPPEAPSLDAVHLPPDSVYYTTCPTLHFSNFSDQDGDIHLYTEVRVRGGENCDQEVWQQVVPESALSATLSGADLEYGRTYCVQVRYKDSSMLWSPWSDPEQIRISSGPKKPVNASPSAEGNLESGNFIEGSPFEDAFVSHMASEWLICRGEDFLCVVYAGRTAENAENLTRLAPHDLRQDRIYSWQVRYQNLHGVWSEWSDPTAFVFMPFP